MQGRIQSVSLGGTISIAPPGSAPACMLYMLNATEHDMVSEEGYQADCQRGEVTWLCRHRHRRPALSIFPSPKVGNGGSHVLNVIVL